MDKTPEIEIVIPTYNRLSYLRLALKSALKQNYENYIVTVVDSASNDGTMEFLNGIKSDKLRVVHFEDNLGISGNWNRALKVTNAQLVGIFHDDDIMLPQFILRQIDMFNSNPDLVLCHTAGEVISGDGKVIFKRKLDWPLVTDGKKFVTRLLTESALVPIPPSVVLNRKLLPADFAFETKFPAMVDLVAWIQAARRGKVGYIDIPLVQYRIHETQTTNSILKSYPEKLRQRELFYEFMQLELIDRLDYTASKAQNAAWSYFSNAISSDLLSLSNFDGSALTKAKVVIDCGMRHPKLWLSMRFWVSALFTVIAHGGVVKAVKRTRNWLREGRVFTRFFFYEK